MSEETQVMARRKNSKRTQGPPPASRRLSVQASEEWIAAVEEGAEFLRTDVSKLVDMALTSYLRAQGFPKTLPKRVP